MSNTPQNTSSTHNENKQNLDGVLKKAEKLQVQINASTLFKKNVDYFVARDPAIYSEYLNYVPTNYQLLIDTNNQLNIINLNTKKIIYNADPKKIARDQVIKYTDNPYLLYTKLSKIPEGSKFIHHEITNAAIERLESCNVESNSPSLDEKIGFMVALGCGLGYHLTELIDEFDIQNLFIYDSEKDFFYASLYCTDWPDLCEHFTKKNGRIALQIGTTPQHTVNSIINYRAKIGLHNTVNMQFFPHFSNEGNIDFKQRLLNQFSIMGAATGFIDDERISLAHTVYNLNKNHPLLIHAKKEIDALPPVILIANGPSLDSQIPFIKDNIHKAILVSCGSALGTLYKLGIKPDIHIEMERCLTTAQFIEYSTDIDYTKSIDLLCLNTVSPIVIEKFNRVFIATKASDLGCEIIAHEISDQPIKILEDCNPTVSNAGLAFICTLGFKEVFLMGTDFGMAKKEEHHSKNSVYNNLDKDSPVLKLMQKIMFSGQHKTQGNLCEEVYTTSLLNNSKRVVEILLEKNPDILCINSCDGAFINGSKSVKIANLNINNDVIINKKETINRILANNFYTPENLDISEEYIKNKYMINTNAVKKAFTLTEEITDIKTLYEHISIIFSNLKVLEKDAPIMHQLLKGSIEIHLALVYSYCIRTKTTQEFRQCYRIGKEQLGELVDGIIDIMDHKLLTLDDTTMDGLS
jgi:hypothetical protein